VLGPVEGEGGDAVAVDFIQDVFKWHGGRVQE
jgi:hypothetical protein